MNSKTLLYILKRIGLAIVTVWVVVTVTFFVTRIVPGGPFLGEKAISEAAQAALEMAGDAPEEIASEEESTAHAHQPENGEEERK